MKYEALFAPLKIRGLELKNRVVMPGMCTKMVREKHFIDDNLIAYHVERVKGGCGLNMFECSAVSPAPHAYMYMGIYTEEDVAQLRRLTDAVHEAGGRIGIQLWHGGFTPAQYFDETNTLETPDNLSVDRIHEIEKEFGRAAGLAVKAGFDLVEFHAAHSYLPHEFLSPGTNKRSDEYGGTFENRCRFCLETIREIRGNIPEDMPLFMRVDGIDELMEQTMTQDEIAAFINMAADLGVDVADVSRGNCLSFASVYEVPSYNVPQGFNIENIAAMKAKVKIPVMGVGRINEPAMADKAVAEGKFDLVGIGRAQLADPEWANKARRGEEEIIRHCIACDQGCYDSIVAPGTKHITCTRNPMLGLEYKGLGKAETPKKVMVVGGGTGGMMAAQLLKLRGHEPVLYEATEKLGGQFYLAGLAPMKQETAECMLWEARETARMGIEIHCSTTVTADTVEKERPDAVVFAAGATPVIPPIPVAEGAKVYDSHEVLAQGLTLSGKVVIIGGGSVGTEVAEYVVARGAQCTVLEMQKRIASDLGMIRKMFMKAEFKKQGIETITLATCTEIGPDHVTYTREGESITIPCDAVIMAVGTRRVDSSEIEEKCKELDIDFYAIGDAVQPRDALAATAEARDAALAI